MQESKKNLELLLINYFRACYPGFPKGSIQPDESPDFLLKLKNKKTLGIEIIHLHPKDINVARQELCDHPDIELIESCKELFESRSEFKLFVKFNFDKSHSIIQERILAVSAQVSTLIRKSIEGKNPRSFFYFSISEKQLPNGINDILVIHNPILNESIWEPVNRFGQSQNLIDDIQYLIQKKNEKIEIYRKKQLDKLWLLIISDRLRAKKSYNVVNQLQKQSFSSRFDRVVLFDLIKSDIFELTT